MVTVLSSILSKFPGPANHVQCMAHIVHLVVQVILHQFDAPKSKSKKKKVLAPLNKGKDEAIDSKLDDELTKDLDKEELEMDKGGNDDIVEDVLDDIEKIERAVREEITEAAEQVKPVQHVLLKVCFPASGLALADLSCLMFSTFSTFLCQLCKLAYAIKNSTTIVLPQWREIVKELGKSNPKICNHMMPWDVWTQWNSTFNMLQFAYTYHNAIDKLTGEHALKLRDYKVGVGKWEIVRQL